MKWSHYIYYILYIFFLHKFMYSALEQALSIKRSLYKFDIMIIIIWYYQKGTWIFFLCTCICLESGCLPVYHQMPLFTKITHNLSSITFWVTIFAWAHFCSFRYKIICIQSCLFIIPYLNNSIPFSSKSLSEVLRKVTFTGSQIIRSIWQRDFLCYLSYILEY